MQPANAFAVLKQMVSNRLHPNRHIKDPVFAVLSLQVLLALVQQVVDIVLTEIRGISQETPQQVPVNDGLIPSHMFPDTSRLGVFLHCAGSASSALAQRQACLHTLVSQSPNGNIYSILSTSTSPA